MHHSSTDDRAASNAIDDALERLDLAAKRMVDTAEAQLAARRMRDAGVYVGHPDDLPSETLAAVSAGKPTTAAERSESRSYLRQPLCDACEKRHWPDEQCDEPEPISQREMIEDLHTDRLIDQERGK